MERQAGLHAQDDGLRAKPARGGRLPTGQWRKCPVGRCLRRRLGHHRHQGCRGGGVQGRNEGLSDLGLLSFYLGIEVHQDHSGITLRQTAYAKRVVELAGLTDCNPALTPMEERLKLSRDSTAEEVDATQYRRLVGSLRYLAHTRPDLAFSIGYVSRFMQRPTTEHQQAVKRIVRYVAGTLDHGLYYPRCPGAAHFVGYSDSDHAGDIDTSKSTSGILFFLGKCLLSA
uniref:Uncharacterized protein n=1 Tax=Avena sativa TaxID=4498 RepID=A0ACD6AV42_AVESA